MVYFLSHTSLVIYLITTYIMLCAFQLSNRLLLIYFNPKYTLVPHALAWQHSHHTVQLDRLLYDIPFPLLHPFEGQSFVIFIPTSRTHWRQRCTITAFHSLIMGNPMIPPLPCLQQWWTGYLQIWLLDGSNVLECMVTFSGKTWKPIFINASSYDTLVI